MKAVQSHIRLTAQSLLIALCAALSPATAQAALFDLFYDDSFDATLDLGNIIGTGTFAYDGPVTAGHFLLSDLTGVSMSVNLVGEVFSGPLFDPLDLSLIGIAVEDQGAGLFNLVFTGSSASTAGSLDIVKPNSFLTHEPQPLGSLVVNPNLYFASVATGANPDGTYLGISRAAEPVSAPGSLMLLALGLIMGAARRRLR